MKKALSIIVTLCMIISLLATTAYAQSNVASVISNGITTEYPSLAGALSAAASGDVVNLFADETLTVSATVGSGVTLNIASGVTLIIPNAATVTNPTTGSNHQGSVNLLGPYVTLEVDENATVNVYGTLVVCGDQQSTQPKTSCLTGYYGRIELNGTIYLEAGAELYARGIIDGNGTVIAKDGSIVYQLFQVEDWRGGSATETAYNAGVFPFNLYRISNITATTEYMNGSYLLAQFYVGLTFLGRYLDYLNEIIIIGDGGLLSFTGVSSTDNIMITYDLLTDRFLASVDGDVAVNDIAVWIDMRIFGIPVFSMDISSAGMILPFGYDYDVEVFSGSLTVSNEIKLLPGCELNVNSGAELIIDNNAALYLYNVDNYNTSYNFKGWNGSSDAQVTGSGTVTVNGTFAESTDVTSTLNVKEYIQSNNSTVNVPFVEIITII